LRERDDNRTIPTLLFSTAGFRAWCDVMWQGGERGKEGRGGEGRGGCDEIPTV